ELGRGEIVNRAAKIRVIQDVEEIASRLKRKPLGQAELSAQRDVPLRGAESAQSIASQIALYGGRHRRGESCRVDHLASGCARRIKVDRHAGDDIRALHAISA